MTKTKTQTPAYTKALAAHEDAVTALNEAADAGDALIRVEGFIKQLKRLEKAGKLTAAHLPKSFGGVKVKTAAECLEMAGKSLLTASIAAYTIHSACEERYEAAAKAWQPFADK